MVFFMSSVLRARWCTPREIGVIGVSRNKKGPRAARGPRTMPSLTLVDISVGEVAAVAAVLLVDLLVVGHLVVLQRGLHLRRIAVEAGVVAAEDGALHRPVGRPHRLQAVLLLDLVGDLHAAQRL